MRTSIMTLFFSTLLFFSAISQNSVKGIIKDSDSEDPIEGVSVKILTTTIVGVTDANGAFELTNFSNGNFILEISFTGYETQNFPLQFDGNTIDLGSILLYQDITEDLDLSTITITDDELNDDAGAADNISGLLQATRDVYLRTAAFDFSGSFFRIKGLDSENGTVMINGIEMNKLFDGRPQWSNWGGLNDVTRNQEFSNGLTPSNYTFGGLLGTTNINTRASEQRPGIRVSYASSNRSYIHRVMATYASGMQENGWAYAISASRRAGTEGFNDGTSYNANSIFASVEKKINDRHSINITSILAPNKRGKSSPNTQEVYDLKDIKYNSYWGYQNGKIRNSRYKELIEPIVILNHYWNINENTSLTTNIGYQFGSLGNSRIDFGGTDINPNSGFPEGGGANPDPTYYQKLPSYGARNFPNMPEVAFGLQQQFLNDGQLDWSAMYQTNIANASQGRNATFIQYEDRIDDKQFTMNVVLNSSINENIIFNGSLNYKNLISNNFANILDLLGGSGYLDIDNFADDLTNNPNQIQNNLLNPNRIVGTGDTFRYNYNILSSIIGGFAQVQFTYNKVDFYTALNYTNTNYQREGLYQNGGFANSSLGKGRKLSFNGLGAKAGVTYKLTGRHLFDANAAYFTKAPSIRNTFANSRENHAIVPNITEEKILSFDAGYVLRSPKIQARLTGYYTKIEDANEISFFFADGIGGDNAAFIQEILQGIDKQHIGVEFGIEYQVIPTTKLKGVASVGQHTYTNNPNLYIASEDFVNTTSTDPLIRDFGLQTQGEASLKDYKLANGPQQAFSVGFEYRDPDFWWFGTTVNFLSNAYIDISPIQRSSNFYTDFDGQPFNEYDPVVARRLLQQEKIDGYVVTNLVGGKSWKVQNTFVSIFASVNNLFNTVYRTGGFESGRNANYRQLLADTSLSTPVFGPRYWYGRGTTYFLNVNLRF
ncbi:MAG: TonB-dependent receptor [Flavobacteriaceae bacterium]|nr:MAG: TonB-dependent receptor [Flavobacteriaceae bacterium]